MAATCARVSLKSIIFSLCDEIEFLIANSVTLPTAAAAATIPLADFVCRTFVVALYIEN